MFNFLWRQQIKTEVNTYTLTVTLIGIFGGLSSIFYFGAFTFIRIDTVVNIALISGAVVFLIHLPFMKKLNRFLAEIVVYSFAGWGFMICGMVIAVNFMVHSKPEVNFYEVITATAHPEYRVLPFPVTVTIHNSSSEPATVDAEAYADFGYLLKFDGEGELKFKDRPAMAVMTTAKGLFGYRILLRKELY